MWTGQGPTEQTPPGATYVYNTIKPLKGMEVVGLGVMDDRDNPGEFVATILLGDRKTGQAFVIRAWRDEEQNGPGWLEVTEVHPRIDNP